VCSHREALLFEALSVACDAAEQTGGAVDPTIGNAIAALGYDADLAEVQTRPPAPPHALGPVVGYRHVKRDARHRTVRIPRGVRLDLGSSAKAFGADRAAARIAARIGTGILVSLGGDVAVAGPPPAGGWAKASPGSRRPRPSASTRWWPSRRADWPAPPPRSGPGGFATVLSNWPFGFRKACGSPVSSALRSSGGYSCD
jgi:hypothetical protein